jgi:hypothetical protein
LALAHAETAGALCDFVWARSTCKELNGADGISDPTCVRHLPDYGAASLLIWRLMFGF